jgi:hypothetical protein
MNFKGEKTSSMGTRVQALGEIQRLCYNKHPPSRRRRTQAAAVWCQKQEWQLMWELCSSAVRLESICWEFSPDHLICILDHWELWSWDDFHWMVLCE